ncbi:unnamed protein product, partial [marine sediment metagenome]
MSAKKTKNKMKHKLTIAMYVNGMEINPGVLESKSLGGSETAGVYMAHELAALGHNVILFGNITQPAEHKGVSYVNHENYLHFISHHAVDVNICQRMPQVFHYKNKAKINILWAHDLMLKRARANLGHGLWNID